MGKADPGRHGLPGWAAWLRHSGNLHAVLPGEIYRSTQLSAAQLTAWTITNGFRGVLNLRGASGADWYRIERATAEHLNLQHADFAMRDSKVLEPDQAAALIARLDRRPKPVLIHCKAGADRTGVAAALYLARKGRPKRRSRSAMAMSRCPSVRLGRWTKAGRPWSRHSAMTAEPLSPDE